jgi:DNA replication initiation complex subunit (GINS family)
VGRKGKDMKKSQPIYGRYDRSQKKIIILNEHELIRDATRDLFKKRTGRNNSRGLAALKAMIVRRHHK